MTAPINDEERMVLAAARELADGEVCFVGIGLPSLAAVVAKLTFAPGLILMYESGAADVIPSSPPLSTGSPCVIDDAAYIGDCLAAFGALQADRLDVGILSAAQIDRRGNLNSTVIGDYAKPKLRMVGSGGAHDIAALIRRVVIVMPHEPRRFVEAVDFVTSPGHPAPSERGEQRAGGGPAAVITPRARFVFEDGEMTLDALQPGFTADEAVEGFGWTPGIREEPGLLPQPDPAAVEVLRAWIGSSASA
jgi:glutaconate CoA-transferase subunit B